MSARHVYLVVAGGVTGAVLAWLRSPLQRSGLDVHVLVAQASSGDPSERLRAVEQMVKLGAAAVPGLERLLAHGDPNVRAVALMGAGRIGPAARPLVPRIREQLCSGNSLLRHEAIVALARVAPDEFPDFPEVHAAFNDPDSAVREQAVRGLAGGGRRSVPLLIRALESADRQMQTAALQTAARLGRAAADAVPYMVPLTHGKQPLLRFTAYCALGKVGGPAVPVLADMLRTGQTREERLGAAVGLALAEDDAEAALPALLRAVEGEEDTVALAAALALAHCRPDGSQRAAVVRVLEAVALDKRRDAVVELGGTALGEAWKMIVGVHAGDWYSALRFLEAGLRVELDRRIGALIALATPAATSPTAFHTVHSAVRSRDPLLRRAACMALALVAQHNTEAVDVLESLCDDPDPAVRSIAQRVVERVQAEEFARYVSHAAGAEASQR